jgi:hypothetical protein
MTDQHKIARQSVQGTAGIKSLVAACTPDRPIGREFDFETCAADGTPRDLA